MKQMLCFMDEWECNDTSNYKTFLSDFFAFFHGCADLSADCCTSMNEVVQHEIQKEEEEVGLCLIHKKVNFAERS